MSWIKHLCTAGPNVLRLKLQTPTGLQNDFICHLPAMFLILSLYGPCSKPLSLKQLDHSVAIRCSLLAMMLAKELKELLTEDRELPGSGWQGPAGQRAEQKPERHAAGDHTGHG